MGKEETTDTSDQLRSGYVICNYPIRYRDRLGNDRYLYLRTGTHITIVKDSIRSGRTFYQLNPEMLPDGGIALVDMARVRLIEKESESNG